MFFRPVGNIGSQAVDAAVLVFMLALGLTLPFNTDGIVFFVVSLDLNAVVLRDAAVFFAQPANAFEYFRVIFDRAFFVQAGIELIESLFQPNVEAVADGLFFFGFLIGVTIEPGFLGFCIDCAVNADGVLSGFPNQDGIVLVSGILYVAFSTDYQIKITTLA